MKIPIFSILIVAVSFSNLCAQVCSAPTPGDFITCLTTMGVTTVRVTASYSVNLQGANLGGKIIDVNGFNLTVTGNPDVNTGTSVTTSAGGNAGSLTIINSRGESATFTHSGSGPDHRFSDLNDQFVIAANNTLHKAAVASGASILPVILNNFTGNIHNATTQLSWQTATEINNAKFIVETSHQGETFQRIGEVAGAGTTTEPQNYSFTHHTPSAGINYYRLKQVDFDGTFEYSKVIAINAPGSNDVFAFPNPAREKISVQYDQSKGAGNIQLLDALGRRIQANIVGYAGNYEVTLPESLARGTYWLKVERGGKVQTLPVVKE